MLVLDHLAFSAETLEEGRAAVERTLGISVQPGGEHEHFGTHNLLLGLEDGLYFEVIAVNPAAPVPAWPRWFDLDRFTGAPRLSNWICRTEDLAAMLAAYPDGGNPVALQRGDLRWQMAVPPDGVLPYDNMFPALIEWAGPEHPAQRLQASGCRLRRLVLSHPQADELAQTLSQHLQDARVDFETGDPGMRAEFDTPGGSRVLT